MSLPDTRFDMLCAFWSNILGLAGYMAKLGDLAVLSGNVLSAALKILVALSGRIAIHIVEAAFREFIVEHVLGPQ